MDWEDKFSTIVRETELNLAKAKKNLSGKAHNSLSDSCRETSKFPTSKSFLSPTPATQGSFLQSKSHNFNAIGGKLNTSFDNMNTSSIQVLHMQEQIDSQNRTIDKLKHLVKSLDGERDYYKEQIALLKGEVDLLTKTMKHQQPSTFASELKISNVKRELMLEMDKVKSLVEKFEKNTVRRTPAPSPRFDPEFWNIKENLTSSLEQVRLELSQMKGRIDRMEGQIAIDNFNRSTRDVSTESFRKSAYSVNDPLLTRQLYTPTTKTSPSVTTSDLQQLRLAISSVNAKIDNIDKKSQVESRIFDEGNMRPSILSPRRTSFLSSLSRPFDSIIPADDLHSLSDPSDLSDIISDDNNSDDDDDDLDDILSLNLDDDDNKSSFSTGVRDKYGKKGRVEFDLDGLDLSDIDEVNGVEFDTDSLDFDH